MTPPQFCDQKVTSMRGKAKSFVKVSCRAAVMVFTPWDETRTP
jgi:hypothetical protein